MTYGDIQTATPEAERRYYVYISMYETLSQESFAEYAQEKLEEIKARKTAT